jgi:flavin-dependent dehydrogenase
MTLYAPEGQRIEAPMEWIAGGASHALSLSRARMDAILLDRARESGVEAREGFHVSPRIERDGHFSVVEGKADGETIERFSARLVIDASGRNGAFSHQIEQPVSRVEGSRLFGCKVHLRGIEGLGETGELFFFRDGYGGLSTIEGGRTNLCFLTTEATLREAKGDRERLLDLTLRTNPAARRRLRGAAIDGEWLGTGPIRYGRQPSMPGVLSIGDAKAFIDPFTGSGILLALSGGVMAAEIIKQAFAENVGEVGEIARRFDELYRARFGWRFRATALLRGLAFKPTTRNAIASLLSRHQSIAKLVALSTRR